MFLQLSVTLSNLKLVPSYFMVLFPVAIECLFCAGCARWGWRRCAHAGADDSASWSAATISEFAPVPRACRAVLASYEDDLADPRWAPDRPGGYAMDPAGVAKRATYDDTRGRCPPYIIYVDAAAREVVLAVRGLNLARDADYRLLLNDAPAGGARSFDGGYVHLGLLRAAAWLLGEEAGTLRRLLLEGGPEYSLVLAGHSLGAGVAALAAVLIVNRLDMFGGLPRNRVRCYAIAPARCMSLNLAVKYADVVNSVVLQDDFLPRTPTPLQHIFGSIFCLPCLLFLFCMRDTFIPEGKKLKDPRRLYAPGRMYHIVERKSCRCGRFPPEVRTAIPVEGRFEHIVLSCNSIFDHGIIWMEKEAQKALEIMSEKVDSMAPPKQQTMEGKASLEMEQKGALEIAMNLNKPSPSAPAKLVSEQQLGSWSPEFYDNLTSSSSSSDVSSNGSTDWDDLIQKLFDVDETVYELLNSDREG